MAALATGSATGSANRPSRASMATCGMGTRGKATFCGFSGGSGGGRFIDETVVNIGHSALHKASASKHRVFITPEEAEARKEQEKKKKNSELSQEIKDLQKHVLTTFLSLNTGKPGSFNANNESVLWINSTFTKVWLNNPPSNTRRIISKEFTPAKIEEKYRKLVGVVEP